MHPRSVLYTGARTWGRHGSEQHLADMVAAVVVGEARQVLEAAVCLALLAGQAGCLAERAAGRGSGAFRLGRGTSCAWACCWCLSAGQRPGLDTRSSWLPGLQIICFASPLTQSSQAEQRLPATVEQAAYCRLSSTQSAYQLAEVSNASCRPGKVPQLRRPALASGAGPRRCEDRAASRPGTMNRARLCSMVC